METSTVMPSIRPTSWEDYVGQERLKERLKIHIESAKNRASRLDHILLVGPPGCGKTSLVAVIAKDMMEEVMSFKCPIDKKLLAKVVQEHTGILFLDEVHLMSNKDQHDLFTLTEDHYYQLANGHRIYNEYLTIIGATTEADKIVAPLYDRMPIIPPFDPYSDDEMALIVAHVCHKLSLPCTGEFAYGVGRAAAGVPRDGASLVLLARDIASSRGDLVLPPFVEVLHMARVTETGLNHDHLRYLTVLAKMGGAAGLDKLSDHLRLPSSVIRNLEVRLVEQELLEYGTSRTLTSHGYKLLKEFNNEETN